MTEPDRHKNPIYNQKTIRLREAAAFHTNKPK